MVGAVEYYIVCGQERRGPFFIDDLRKQNLAADSLVWRAGLPTWTRADQVPELVKEIALLPPGMIATAQGYQAGVVSRTWDELRLTASRQRRLIVGMGFLWLASCCGPIGLAFLADMAPPPAHGPPRPGGGASLTCCTWPIIVGIQVWLLFGVASALKLENTWLWCIGALLPFIGLFVLLALNQKATTALRSAGIHVGFFGASIPDAARTPDGHGA